MSNFITWQKEFQAKSHGPLFYAIISTTKHQPVKQMNLNISSEFVEFTWWVIKHSLQSKYGHTSQYILIF